MHWMRLTHFGEDNLLCSILLVIKETKIKTTMRYHLAPLRMAVTLKKKKKEITSIGEAMEKLKPLCAVGGNKKNWSNHHGKQFISFSKS